MFKFQIQLTIQIWTDVDGVFTCDPREVSNSYLLESISYKEAMEYLETVETKPTVVQPVAPTTIQPTPKPVEEKPKSFFAKLFGGV